MKKFTAHKIIGAIMENMQESRKEWLLVMFENYGRSNSNNTKYQFWQQDKHPVQAMLTSQKTIFTVALLIIAMKKIYWILYELNDFLAQFTTYRLPFRLAPGGSYNKIS